MNSPIAMRTSTQVGPGKTSTCPVAKKSPSAKSRVSPGRNGKKSPHSTKMITRLSQNSAPPKCSSSQ